MAMQVNLRRKLPRPMTACAIATLAAGGFVVAYIAARQSAGVRPVVSPSPAPPGMRWIPGGEFTMGTDDSRSFANERPAHRVAVADFWMDEHDVTNDEFNRFIDATGYVTTADGRLLLFSALANNYTVPTRRVDQVTDALGAWLAGLRLDR